MGRFAPKFTSDQRQAIASLHLDQGMTGTQIVAKAAAGIDGHNPFEISKPTVYEIAATERRRREQQATLDGDTTAVQARVYKILDRELAGIERQQRRGELDPRALRRLKLIGQTYTPTGEPARESAAQPIPPKRTKLQELAELEALRAEQTDTDPGEAPRPPANEAQGRRDEAQQQQPRVLSDAERLAVARARARADRRAGSAANS
jgi:hypothetical protein